MLDRGKAEGVERGAWDSALQEPGQPRTTFYAVGPACLAASMFLSMPCQ